MAAGGGWWGGGAGGGGGEGLRVRGEPGVAGRSLEGGGRFLLLFGSANRDGAVFEDPDGFHLGRRDGRHLAFGIGPHRCIGSHLARLEVRIAVEEFIKRVPKFSLAPGPDPGWYQAGPLNVVWAVVT